MTTLKMQDEIVKVNHPKSKIEYWNERINNGNVTYRKIDYIEDCYVEFIILPESWTKSLVKKSLNLTKRYDQTNPTQIYA